MDHTSVKEEYNIWGKIQGTLKTEIKLYTSISLVIDLLGVLYYYHHYWTFTMLLVYHRYVLGVYVTILD